MKLLVLIIFLPSITLEQITVCKKIDSNKVDEEITSDECVGQTVFYEELGRKGDTGSRGEKGSKGESGINGSKGCPGVTFHFPRNYQITDYVKYLPHFPRLKDATVCTWIEKNQASIDVQNEEPILFITILSYFMNEDELLIGITPTRKLYFRIKTTPVYITANLPSENQMFHLCVQMMSSKNQVKVYVNGTQQAAVDYIYDVVPGRGSMTVGQEQDGVNFYFKGYHAFGGNITNLMIWSRLLSDQEINNIATNCDCPQDYSVAMTMDRSELYGGAYYSVPDQCPTL